jgi:pimeloyl-ACP methyl ester carboxylesterase
MQRILVGDTHLAVLKSGHHGYPLLLVHGFPLDHSQWQPQIDYFADHCRVIAPDLRGFGASDVRAGAVTMEQMADDLHNLLNALAIHEKVIFCGLSLGGYVGWQFWRKYRERVLAMILCDTRSAADTADGAAGRRQLAAKVLAEGSTVAAEAMIPKLFASETRQQQPELVDRVRQMMAANPPAGLAAALEGMAIRPDAQQILSTIDVPTLVIVGEHDAIATVDEMRGMADAIPDAGWVVVPHAGHLAPLENPTVVNDAIAEFIAR